MNNGVYMLKLINICNIYKKYFAQLNIFNPLKSKFSFNKSGQ